MGDSQNEGVLNSRRMSDQLTLESVDREELSGRRAFRKAPSSGVRNWRWDGGESGKSG